MTFYLALARHLFPLYLPAADSPPWLIFIRFLKSGSICLALWYWPGTFFLKKKKNERNGKKRGETK